MPTNTGNQIQEKLVAKLMVELLTVKKAVENLDNEIESEVNNIKPSDVVKFKQGLLQSKQVQELGQELSEVTQQLNTIVPAITNNMPSAPTFTISPSAQRYASPTEKQKKFLLQVGEWLIDKGRKLQGKSLGAGEKKIEKSFYKVVNKIGKGLEALGVLLKQCAEKNEKVPAKQVEATVNDLVKSLKTVQTYFIAPKAVKLLGLTEENIKPRKPTKR